MDAASMNWTVLAENTTGTVLILVAALVEAIRRLSKRLSGSRLTLETDSFVLTTQTKPHSSQQESPLLEQGGTDNANSDDDDGRIPATNQRSHF